jgi:molybdopterin-guanine dinucleotide biosynthesis protein A
LLVNDWLGLKVAQNIMVENAETAFPPLVPGVILAGGLSRRMGGGDKCLLPLAGRPVLAHVIERIRPQVAVLALNANGDATRFADFGLPVVPDDLQDFAGPLAGILAALDWAAQRTTGRTTGAQPVASHILTVPADTPFLPRDLLIRLAARRDGVVLARSGGRVHPVVGLWPLHQREDLRRALRAEGLRKVEDWTGRIGAALVDFDTAPIDPFFNVNTPEDLVTAGGLL